MEEEKKSTSQVAPMGNMDIWNFVSKVPADMTKAFTNGRFTGTDIKPIWRFKILTDVFGPCGFGWYIDNVRFWMEQGADGNVKTFCELDLFVKHPATNEWSMSIHGIGGNSFVNVVTMKDGTVKKVTDDEGYKAAYTDAVSVACKAIGIGADIYAGNPGLDSSKYAQFYKEAKGSDDNAGKKHTKQETNEQSPLDIAIDELNKARTKNEARSVYAKYCDSLKEYPEFRNRVIELGQKLPDTLQAGEKGDAA